MMEYLTYEEYTNLGGTLDLTAFSRNITKVCGIIENATQGRIQALYGIPKEVKMLCCDLVEYLAEVGKTDRTVKSVSQGAGGVSESITYIDDATIYARIDDMMYDYLGAITTKDGTPILYKGARY